MTAVLYAKLVEQGRAAWDTTLPAFFPNWSVHPDWEQTTICDLLSHRAGLSDAVIDREWTMRAHNDARDVSEQRAEFAFERLTMPPSSSPGLYIYANTNYIIAGAIIEHITGTSWEMAIQRDLFDPLGMATAGHGAPRKLEDIWGHHMTRDDEDYDIISPVDPHQPDGDVPEPGDNPAIFGPAGRVHMSVKDWAKFIQLYLTQGGPDGYLQPDTVHRLMQGWKDLPYAYGLGWMVYKEREWARGPALAHDGSNTLWFASIAMAPARGLAMMAVTNVGGKMGADTTAAAIKEMVAVFAP
eukprot:TRINITY_DN7339_c0_g1_i1.p1 TRINITY_DN7339_c0_g1~~TRINITY_DN7339_c0_g1_i1.p1  ORF type:complete len:340 (-),score=98.02 TRINITY_DN7339_c0_g1_i1:213-1106(-)